MSPEDQTNTSLSCWRVGIYQQSRRGYMKPPGYLTIPRTDESPGLFPKFSHSKSGRPQPFGDSLNGNALHPLSEAPVRISWAGAHRQMIADWMVSPMMIRLRQTHNELVEVYELLLDVLDRLTA